MIEYVRESAEAVTFIDPELVPDAMCREASDFEDAGLGMNLSKRLAFRIKIGPIHSCRNRQRDEHKLCRNTFAILRSNYVGENDSIDAPEDAISCR